MRATHGTVGDVVVDWEKNELLGMQFKVLKLFHKFFGYLEYSRTNGWDIDIFYSAKLSANSTRMLSYFYNTTKLIKWRMRAARVSAPNGRTIAHSNH